MPGHWLLARLGKRVLRPGGRQLTDFLLDGLAITAEDHVVELAPGVGGTTGLVLERRPATYTGIEQDEHAAGRVRALLDDERYRCNVGTAQRTGLDDAVASVVFGEAFLTMQSDEQKEQIVAEAFRLLRPGGRYGLHELALRPDGLPDEVKHDVRAELSRSIHVGARPVTVAAWRAIVERAGFEVVAVSCAPMALLQVRRVLADEGVRGALRVGSNLLRDPQARARVAAMRSTFRARADTLAAVGLIARKPLVAAPTG
jgi:cyclopropane fatty-acyl-phospholipid synthase-like methyltransferase